MEKEKINSQFLGKGKTGRWCGFRERHFCNKNCGMFCEALGSCVLHGINLNLQRMKKVMESKK